MSIPAPEGATATNVPRHGYVHKRTTEADCQMSPDNIRKVAREIDYIARQHCPEGCRPDLVIGNAIDHLYAMAKAEETRLAETR
jgi:hypothetical protein